MRYFISSFIILIIGMVGGYLLGGLEGVYIAFLLVVLEVSLSFDNAIVNAKTLSTMDEVWQNRFMVFGMPIAVFGMRLLFPLAIVAIVGDMGLLETLHVALYEPHRYESILQGTEVNIFAFGGAFLLMVFLDFFFEEHDVTWIKFLEDSKMIRKFSGVMNIELIIAIAIGLLVGHITHDSGILLAFLYGVLLHSILGMVDGLFSTESVKSGLAGFIYLEVLDASFSFDGVIGAFALSSNIFIIMIGLGVGAMFVRSITLVFVKHQTLSEYQYLEHGAHYAIGILAVIMLIKIVTPINEAITGTVGVGLILAAFIHSVLENKRTLS